LNILYIKSLHIIFVITWFAGLFYIVRLFIYHSEAENKPEPEKAILQAQYILMEKRLWYGITWPSMVLTYIFGFWYAFELFGADFPGWLWMKLAFVFGLTLYHFRCQSMFAAFQKGMVRHSSLSLRLWNEVTTVFLFAIVFIVVVKDAGEAWKGFAGLFLVVGALVTAVFAYKKRREKKSDGL
jgi:putative membrane protein